MADKDAGGSPSDNAGDGDGDDFTPSSFFDADNVPQPLTEDQAAQRLEQGIEGLLGLEPHPAEGDQDLDQSSDEDDDDDENDDDQGDKRQSKRSEDDDDEGDDDDDQGDDGQSDDDEAGLQIFTKGKDGRYKAVDPTDVEVPITVEGDEQFVTLKEASEGFMRRQDYTRKTQQLATRIADGVQEGTQQRMAELNQRAEGLEAIVKTFSGLLEREPDLQALRQTLGNDDVAFNAFTQQTRMKKAYDEAKREVENARKQADQANVSEMIETANRTMKIVRESIPEWKDQRIFKREERLIVDHMRAEGLDDRDILAVFQKPAYVNFVRDAMQTRRLQKAKDKLPGKRLRQKGSSNSKRQRQGGGTQSNPRAVLRKRVRQTGDAAAATALIESTLS